MEPLLVHQHLVIRADGRETLRRFVRCPARGEAVSVQTCNACVQGRGLAWDERLERDVVDCTLAPLAETTVMPAHARRIENVGEAFRSAVVEEAMSHDVVCVAPDCDVRSVRRLMAEEAIGMLVVVDDDDAVLGAVSATRLAEVAVDELGTARALMARPLMVPPSMPLVRAAAIMAYEGAHHLVVTCERDTLAGVLSAIDVLRYLGQAAGSLIPRATARQRRERSL